MLSCRPLRLLVSCCMILYVSTCMQVCDSTADVESLYAEYLSFERHGRYCYRKEELKALIMSKLGENPSPKRKHDSQYKALVQCLFDEKKDTPACASKHFPELSRMVLKYRRAVITDDSDRSQFVKPYIAPIAVNRLSCLSPERFLRIASYCTPEIFLLASGLNKTDRSTIYTRLMATKSFKELREEAESFDTPSLLLMAAMVSDETVDVAAEIVSRSPNKKYLAQMIIPWLKYGFNIKFVVEVINRLDITENRIRSIIFFIAYNGLSLDLYNALRPSSKYGLDSLSMRFERALVLDESESELLSIVQTDGFSHEAHHIILAGIKKKSEDFLKALVESPGPKEYRSLSEYSLQLIDEFANVRCFFRVDLPFFALEKLVDPIEKWLDLYCIYLWLYPRNSKYIVSVIESLLGKLDSVGPYQVKLFTKVLQDVFIWNFDNSKQILELISRHFLERSKPLDMQCSKYPVTSSFNLNDYMGEMPLEWLVSKFPKLRFGPKFSKNLGNSTIRSLFHYISLKEANLQQLYEHIELPSQFFAIVLFYDYQYFTVDQVINGIDLLDNQVFWVQYLCGVIKRPVNQTVLIKAVLGELMHRFEQRGTAEFMALFCSRWIEKNYIWSCSPIYDHLTLKHLKQMLKASSTFLQNVLRSNKEDIYLSFLELGAEDMLFLEAIKQCNHSYSAIRRRFAIFFRLLGPERQNRLQRRCKYA